MQGFALLAYNAAAATAGASNVDFSAATDPDFSQRNSHYIFTEDYDVMAVLPVGASLTRGRWQIPHVNSLAEAQIFSANRSATVPSNPQWDSYFAGGFRLPQNEELQVQFSNNLGAATEAESVGILLAPAPWERTLPGFMPFGNVIARASFTVTPTVNAWSGPQQLTFSTGLRGGRWAVCGAVCQGTNSAFFRLIFPKYNLYRGTRKLRPGWFVQNAIGDQPTNLFGTTQSFSLGQWGMFDTFEPLTAEVFGITASSTTYQLFLWLRYVSESVSQGTQMG